MTMCAMTLIVVLIVIATGWLAALAIFAHGILGAQNLKSDELVWLGIQRAQLTHYTLFPS